MPSDDGGISRVGFPLRFGVREMEKMAVGSGASASTGAVGESFMRGFFCRR